jgi:hypothetical protein
MRIRQGLEWRGIAIWGFKQLRKAGGAKYVVGRAQPDPLEFRTDRPGALLRPEVERGYVQRNPLPCKEARCPAPERFGQAL